MTSPRLSDRYCERQRKRVRMDLSLYRMERELSEAVEQECEAAAALREALEVEGFERHGGLFP